MRRSLRASALCFSVVACTRQHERPADSEAAATPAAAVAVALPDSAALQAGPEVLGKFLAASREGSTTRHSLDRLTACPGGVDHAQGPMLAAFELLAPSSRGDTVVARAVVTTVAEQDVDRVHPGYFVARMRVRQDTLEWDILRSRSGDRVVCNGLRFGLTAADSLTTWRPPGASAEAARALADSIGAVKR